MVCYYLVVALVTDLLKTLDGCLHKLKYHETVKKKKQQTRGIMLIEEYVCSAYKDKETRRQFIHNP